MLYPLHWLRIRFYSFCYMIICLLPSVSPILNDKDFKGRRLFSTISFPPVPTGSAQSRHIGKRPSFRHMYYVLNTLDAASLVCYYVHLWDENTEVQGNFMKREHDQCHFCPRSAWLQTCASHSSQPHEPYWCFWKTAHHRSGKHIDE